MPVEMQPTSVINARLGINPGGTIEKFFASECAKAMDKYVPFDEGILAQYTVEGNRIIYGDNGSRYYAKYQYYGVRKDGTHAINPDNRDRSKHPLATSYWDKVMWSAEGQDIVRKVQDKIGGI